MKYDKEIKAVTGAGLDPSGGPDPGLQPCSLDYLIYRSKEGQILSGLRLSN